jgi:hypothetical protein
MLKHWISVAMLVAVTVCGCATSYQKHGLTGGYNETKINDSAYIVSFNGNGYASKDRVWYFWIYRCAELTSQQGYKLFALRQNRTSAVAPPEGNFVPAVYNPDEAGGFMKVKGGAPTYVYTPGYTVTTWNSSATVLMYQQPLPREVPWALNSQALLDRLKPYVTSNGSAPVPSRGDLLKLAFVAHERVDIGSRIKISATDPAAGTTGSVSPVAASPVLQPRPVNSIQSGIDFPQMLLLHASYRDHAARTMDIVGGQIVLEFVISPNGPVSEAHVVSTTFTDRQFVAFVLEVIRRTDFGPSKAAETRVAELPISFSPAAYRPDHDVE